MYVTERIDSFPAVSLAVTTNVFVPAVDESAAAPFATVPWHPTTPDTSVQEYEATTYSFIW